MVIFPNDVQIHSHCTNSIWPINVFSSNGCIVLLYISIVCLSQDSCISAIILRHAGKKFIPSGNSIRCHDYMSWISIYCSHGSMVIDVQLVVVLVLCKAICISLSMNWCMFCIQSCSLLFWFVGLKFGLSIRKITATILNTITVSINVNAFLCMNISYL